MARLPRLTVTGLPHLVLWQGHNRQNVFVDDDDRRAFLSLVFDTAAREDVALHGYVLLDTSVWLLATPQRPGALSRFMQGVGRSYVRRFNQRHGRTGTLWEGRYRTTVIAPQEVLAALVFLDLEPVRAGLAAAPKDWAWSSHRHYVGDAVQRGLQPPAAWWALGDTPFAREAAYQKRAREGLQPDEERRLRTAATKGWPLGDAAFLAALQAQTGRRIQPARPGRPRKTNSSSVPK